MQINTDELLAYMLQEIKHVVSSSLLDQVQPELEALAQQIAAISVASLHHDISTAEGKLLLDMQKHAWQTELFSIQGRSEIAVQLLIKQALTAVHDWVNGKLGWALL